MARTCVALLLLVPSSVARPASGQEAGAQAPMIGQRAPTLGADLFFANDFSPLIDAWRDKQQGDEMAAAFQAAGLKSLRFSSHGYYSAGGEEATRQVKAENKLTNQFPWFPLDNYVDFIATHDFTTVFGVNVEEGAQAAVDAVQKFLSRGLQAKLVAVELSNEPWLNYRPWQPEEYAARAAEVIERLTPLGVRLALPLTVGNDNNTPTKLTDTAWNTRMLRALTRRVDLKNRTDIYGVLHLYSGGVRSKSVDYFNQIVRPFAPRMRYLVTEFNIRLSLEGNPHLTNKYALEMARKLADVMHRPEIDAMYIHAVPYHSVLYWANRRGRVTVVGQRDERLKGEALNRGWHLTPAGQVYSFYSRLAWNGDVLWFRGGDHQSYWAVRTGDGREVITLLNDDNRAAKQKVKFAGRELQLTAPPRAIVCFAANGQEIERLVLPY
ncbi:MAG TPA: hypothetical protein VKA60_24745 [Blastocatellia bacterium]|nr:hypothetical protein [Blastocatellia bacterium]